MLFLKGLILKRLNIYKKYLSKENLSDCDIEKYQLLIKELESILSDKSYEDSLEKIDMKVIDIRNRKEVESLIRNNRVDILENEEIIVNKLSEGINIGLYRKNKLIGYLLGSYEYVNELYKNEDVLLKVENLNSKDIFIISDILIDKKSRKNGHGTFLLEHLLKECTSDLILIMGRNESGGRVWQAKSLCLNLGFEELCKCPDFWLEASILEAYECLSCNFKCHCEMELLFLKRSGILILDNPLLNELLHSNKVSNKVSK